MKKYAIRFIRPSETRTYIVENFTTTDALLQALELFENAVPGVIDEVNLCVIIKLYPQGAHLADASVGPLIDATRPVHLFETELEAA